MKKHIKILFAIIAVLATIGLSSCANMRWGANAGLDVNFGPNGPKLNPHVNLDLYSGGKL